MIENPVIDDERTKADTVEVEFFQQGGSDSVSDWLNSTKYGKRFCRAEFQALL